jgi:N-acetylmuramoyl-L-alanine amidase
LGKTFMRIAACSLGALLQGFHMLAGVVRLGCMPIRPKALLLSLAVGTCLLALPAAAAADVPHVVLPGETLTSVAKTDGLTIAAIAAANDISPNAELIVGEVLQIPAQTAATQATAATGTAAGHSYRLASATTTTTVTTPARATTTAATTTTTTAAPKAAVSSSDVPLPTPQYVSASEIAQIADADGVPAGLAEGIAWQESGWDNDVVSGIGAVGVMQIVPSTWTWIDDYLTPSDPLAPASALENVRGGVLLLHDLLGLTDGNESLAIASYYQGLSSVREHGMYADTKQYVADVLALSERFSG